MEKKLKSNLLWTYFTYILCIVAAVMGVSLILYTNFRKLILSKEYDTRVTIMENRGKYASAWSKFIVQNNQQLFKDVNITRLLCIKEPEVYDESGAIYTIRKYLSSMPYMQSVYAYNPLSQRVYCLINNSNIDFNKGKQSLYKDENFPDQSAIDIMNHVTNYSTSTPIARHMKIGDQTEDIYTYVYYDIFSKQKNRRILLLNFSKEMVHKDMEISEKISDWIIVDKEGTIVSDSVKYPMLTRIPDELKGILSIKENESGSLIKEVEGENSLIVYTKETDMGWRYLSITPYTDVIGKLKEMRDFSMIITCLISAIGVLVALLSSRLTTKPMNHMNKRVQELLSEKKMNEEVHVKERVKDILCYGGVSNNSIELKELLISMMDFEEEKDWLGICKVRLDQLPSLKQNYDRETLNQIRGILFDQLKGLLQQDQVVVYQVNLINSEELLLLKADHHPTRDQIEQRIEQLYEYFHEQKQLSFRLYMGDFIAGLNDIIKLFNEMDLLQSRDRWLNDGDVIWYEDLILKDITEYQYPVAKEKNMIGLIQLIKMQEAYEIYLSMIEETKEYPDAIYQMTMSRVYIAIYNTLENILVTHQIKDYVSIEWIPNIVATSNSVTESNEKIWTVMNTLRVYLEENKSNQRDTVVEKINQAILEQYTQFDISVEKLASQVGLSTTYMCHIFKRETGVTVNEKIIGCRMERARELLQEGKKNVAEIAEELGFTSDSYFCRTFKKRNGMTPNEYRNKK